MKLIKELNDRFSKIEESFDIYEDDEQLLYDLEEDLYSAFDQAFEENEIEKLKKLEKRIKAFKKENEFFNEEDELDMMFPDRHDDDFDEDSMN